jgi:hypothetical protein
MSRLAWIVVLVAGCFAAEVPRELPAIVSAIGEGAGDKDALARELFTALLTESGKIENVTRASIERLSHSLSDALWNKHVEKPAAADLAKALSRLVKPSKEPNAVLVTKARTALSRIGIDGIHAEMLSRQMIAVGEQIRGPDDTPVLPAARRRN